MSLILNQIVDFLVSMCGGLLDFFSTTILEAITPNLDKFNSLFSFVTNKNVIEYISFFGILLILALVLWSLIKGMLGKYADTDSPIQVLAWAGAMGAIIMWGPEFYNMFIDIAGGLYSELININVSSGVNANGAVSNGLSAAVAGSIFGMFENGVFDSASQLIGQAYLASNSISSILLVLKLIVLIYLGWQYIKLLFESIERYVIMGVLYYTSPLALAMGTTKQTRKILQNWFRMVLSNLFLLIINVWFIRAFCYAVPNLAGSNITGIPQALLSILMLGAFLRIGCNFDKYLAALGVTTAQTGDGILGDMLATMSGVRGFNSITSNVFGGTSKGLGGIFNSKKNAAPMNVAQGQNRGGGIFGMGATNSVVGKAQNGKHKPNTTGNLLNNNKGDYMLNELGANIPHNAVGPQKTYDKVMAKKMVDRGDAISKDSVAGFFGFGTGNGSISESSKGLDKGFNAMFGGSIGGWNAESVKGEYGHFIANATKDGKTIGMEGYIAGSKGAEQLQKTGATKTITDEYGNSWVVGASGKEASSFFTSSYNFDTPLTGDALNKEFPDAADNGITSIENLDSGNVLRATNEDGSTSLLYNANTHNAQDFEDVPGVTSITAADGTEFFEVPENSAFNNLESSENFNGTIDEFGNPVMSQDDLNNIMGEATNSLPEGYQVGDAYMDEDGNIAASITDLNGNESILTLSPDTGEMPAGEFSHISGEDSTGFFMQASGDGSEQLMNDLNGERFTSMTAEEMTENVPNALQQELSNNGFEIGEGMVSENGNMAFDILDKETGETVGSMALSGVDNGILDTENGIPSRVIQDNDSGNMYSANFESSEGFNGDISGVTTALDTATMDQSNTLQALNANNGEAINNLLENSAGAGFVEAGGHFENSSMDTNGVIHTTAVDADNNRIPMEFSPDENGGYIGSIGEFGSKAENVNGETTMAQHSGAMENVLRSEGYNSDKIYADSDGNMIEQFSNSNGDIATVTYGNDGSVSTSYSSSAPTTSGEATMAQHSASVENILNSEGYTSSNTYTNSDGSKTEQFVNSNGDIATVTYGNDGSVTTSYSSSAPTTSGEATMSQHSASVNNVLNTEGYTSSKTYMGSDGSMIEQFSNSNGDIATVTYGNDGSVTTSYSSSAPTTSGEATMAQHSASVENILNSEGYTSSNTYTNSDGSMTEQFINSNGDIATVTYGNDGSVTTSYSSSAPTTSGETTMAQHSASVNNVLNTEGYTSGKTYMGSDGSMIEQFSNSNGDIATVTYGNDGSVSTIYSKPSLVSNNDPYQRTEDKLNSFVSSRYSGQYSAKGDAINNPDGTRTQTYSDDKGHSFSATYDENDVIGFVNYKGKNNSRMNNSYSDFSREYDTGLYSNKERANEFLSQNGGYTNTGEIKKNDEGVQYQTFKSANGETMSVEYSDSRSAIFRNSDGTVNTGLTNQYAEYVSTSDANNIATRQESMRSSVASIGYAPTGKSYVSSDGNVVEEYKNNSSGEIGYAVYSGQNDSFMREDESDISRSKNFNNNYSAYRNDISNKAVNATTYYNPPAPPSAHTYDRAVGSAVENYSSYARLNNNVNEANNAFSNIFPDTKIVSVNTANTGQGIVDINTRGADRTLQSTRLYDASQYKQPTNSQLVFSNDGSAYYAVSGSVRTEKTLLINPDGSPIKDARGHDKFKTSYSINYGKPAEKRNIEHPISKPKSTNPEIQNKKSKFNIFKSRFSRK